MTFSIKNKEIHTLQEKYDGSQFSSGVKNSKDRLNPELFHEFSPNTQAQNVLQACTSTNTLERHDTSPRQDVTHDFGKKLPNEGSLENVHPCKKTHQLGTATLSEALQTQRCQKGPDVNTFFPINKPDQDFQNSVVFWSAAHRGKWDECTRLLDDAIKHQQPLDVTVAPKSGPDEGLHALWWAANRGQWDAFTRLLDYAIKYQQTVDVTVSPKSGSGQGLHALWWAAGRAKWDVLMRLLEYAIAHEQPLDVTVAPKSGPNEGLHALWWVAGPGQWDVFTRLLEYAIQHQQPLDVTVAPKSGPLEGLHVLWRAASLFKWDECTRLLEYAIAHEQPLDVTVAPKSGANEGLHALWLAAGCGQWDAFTRLLDYAIEHQQQIQGKQINDKLEITLNHFLEIEEYWFLNKIISLHLIDYDFLFYLNTCLNKILENNYSMGEKIEIFYLNFLILFKPQKLKISDKNFEFFKKTQEGLDLTYSLINVFNEKKFPEELKEMISLEFLLQQHPVLKKVKERYKLQWANRIHQNFIEHCKERDLMKKQDPCKVVN